MKTYEITQLVEMTITTKVRANIADQANDEAIKRTERTCNSIMRRYKNINFGDIMADYIPARDDNE
jgi:hypothetical protein